VHRKKYGSKGFLTTLLFNYQRSSNTFRLYVLRISFQYLLNRYSQNAKTKNGGGERDRTDDLLRARQALSQLSYTPIITVVGLGGLEPPTSRLSGVRSNQLSYRPSLKTAALALYFVVARHKCPRRTFVRLRYLWLALLV
jgi:hypothetical protein